MINVTLQLVSTALDTYEEVISEASGAGVDIVTKEYSINWDYTQATFFSLTILTTIGEWSLIIIRRVIMIGAQQ